jgi:FADH2 O2-dependent halogenase
MSRAKCLHELKAEGNYSYSAERFAGDGWLLLGDAAFFVDPIFSSGVGDALYSAKFAAAEIVAALAADDVSAPAFDGYEQKVRRGATTWREFVRLFYATSPVFIQTVNRSAQRLSILRLCEGDVYDSEAPETLLALQNLFPSV